ncbi:MAG: 50S ribosomal protein L25/general stress protein Ctc [Rickettsiales bacterium]|nr:50S ribosomal protein L25/general stress protein Ctc [Rickettsiales bacterium]|tara:strand:+ start:2658 stop:3296 length:639 start_codon:yes stop_codon:yes gene_type:complete
MEAAITFEASKRDNSGTGSARALRREGKVPAVIYGEDKDAVSVAIDANAVTTHYTRGGFFSSLIKIDAGSESFMALPKDIQLHPVSDKVLHVDFVHVTDKSEIHVLIPVKISGRERSKGLRRGGALNVVRHELELVCKPNNIPKAIQLDISNVDIGDSIHISHIELPEGVRPAISDRDFTIATITGRGKKQDADDAAGDATAAGEGEAKKAE